MVVWKGGGGGQPSFTKENCPDPKISCASTATRTDLNLHCPLLPSSSTPLSVFQRLLRIAPKAASSTNEPSSPLRNTQCLYPAFKMADTYVFLPDPSTSFPPGLNHPVRATY